MWCVMCDAWCVMFQVWFFCKILTLWVTGIPKIDSRWQSYVHDILQGLLGDCFASQKPFVWLKESLCSLLTSDMLDIASNSLLKTSCTISGTSVADIRKWWQASLKKNKKKLLLVKAQNMPKRNKKKVSMFAKCYRIKKLILHLTWVILGPNLGGNAKMEHRVTTRDLTWWLAHTKKSYHMIFLVR